MEGKRANRSGWCGILISSVAVVAAVLVVGWNRLLAEEGFIDGERTRIYLDHAEPVKFDADTVPKIDSKALLTLLRLADGELTQSDIFREKLRRVLPSGLASSIPRDKSNERKAIAASIVVQLAYRRHSSGTSRFAEALAILPEKEAETLGPTLMERGLLSQADAAILAASANRFLKSSYPGANDFAVVLQMLPALARTSPSPEWFVRAKSFVEAGTNFSEALPELPGYLRRIAADDDLAKPMLERLSAGSNSVARVEAKLELWRRGHKREPFEALIGRMIREDGRLGFIRILSYLESEAKSGVRPTLPSLRECVSQAAGFHRLPADLEAGWIRTGRGRRSHGYPAYLPSRRFPAFDQFDSNHGNGIVTRVLSLASGRETELQPQAQELVAVVKDGRFSVTDRFQAVDFLQRITPEPAAVAEALAEGFENGSLDWNALPRMARYGARFSERWSSFEPLLNSTNFPYRHLIADYFRRATPENSKLLDRWIAGLRDPDIRAIAAEALGDYGPAARKAASELAELVAADNSAAGLRELRLTSIASLRKIRPEYAAISSALMAALNDKPGARLHAEIVSAAKAAILDLAPADHPDRQAAMRVP